MANMSACRVALPNSATSTTSRTKPSTRESAVPAAITAPAETSRRVAEASSVRAGVWVSWVTGLVAGSSSTQLPTWASSRSGPSSVAGTEPSAPVVGGRSGLGAGPLPADLADPPGRGGDQHDPGDDRDGPAGRAVLGHPHLDRDRAADLAAGLGVELGDDRDRAVRAGRHLGVAGEAGVRGEGADRVRGDRLDRQPAGVVGLEDEPDPDGRRVVGARRRPRGARSLRMVIGNATPCCATVETLGLLLIRTCSSSRVSRLACCGARYAAPARCWPRQLALAARATAASAVASAASGSARRSCQVRWAAASRSTAASWAGGQLVVRRGAGVAQVAAPSGRACGRAACSAGSPRPTAGRTGPSTRPAPWCGRGAPGRPRPPPRWSSRPTTWRASAAGCGRRRRSGPGRDRRPARRRCR